MGKKLAIKGHSIRGKEVIELLEMLGGKNSRKFDGSANMYSYYLSDCMILSDRLSILEDDDFEIFTIEEFWKKYPFKIGDKIIDLKSDKIAEVYKMHWSENNSCVYYNIKYPNNCGCQRKLMDLKPVNEHHTEPIKMKNVLAEFPEYIKTKIIWRNNMSILQCNAPIGWVCPKCGRVYAPFVLCCDYCNSKVVIEQNTAK